MKCVGRSVTIRNKSNSSSVQVWLRLSSQQEESAKNNQNFDAVENLATSQIQNRLFSLNASCRQRRNADPVQNYVHNPTKNKT